MSDIDRAELRRLLAVESRLNEVGNIHKVCHEQRNAAWAVIERVRKMHASGDEWCGYHNSALCECANVYCEECGADWPCPTVQALDGGGIDG